MPHESLIRLSCFFGIFAVMALYELLAPRRARRVSKSGRWFANLAVVVVDTIAVRLVFPAAAVGAALFAENQGWGLFHYANTPYWLAFLASFVILDCVIYLQHVMFHAVPVLWRFHMIHHADLDLDVTSGLRFHPIEIILSMGLKIAVIAVLGPPVWSVIVFEVVLNGTAMFNHSNVRIPQPLDRVLRWFVVTPDMHRVHHSVVPYESNSNFGFNFPWWDRLFGTYKAQPDAGHEGMTLGLTQFQEVTRQSIWWLVMIPFRGKTGDYPINRRTFRSK